MWLGSKPWQTFAFFAFVLSSVTVPRLAQSETASSATSEINTFKDDFNCSGYDTAIFIHYKTEPIDLTGESRNHYVDTQPYRNLVFCHPPKYNVTLPLEIRKQITFSGWVCNYFKNNNETFAIVAKYTGCANSQSVITVGIIPPKYKAVVVSETVYRNIQTNRTEEDLYGVGHFHHRAPNHLEWFRRYVYKIPFHSAYLLQTSYLEVADADAYGKGKIAPTTLSFTRDVYQYKDDGKPFDGKHNSYNGPGHSTETSRRIVNLLSFGTSGHQTRSPYGVVVVLNEVSQYTDGIERHGLTWGPVAGVASMISSNTTAKEIGNEMVHELGHVWGLTDNEGADAKNPDEFPNYCHPQKRRSLHVKYDGEIAYPHFKNGYCKRSAMNGGDLDENDDGLTAYSDYELGIIGKKIRNEYLVNVNVTFSGYSYVLSFTETEANLDVVKINVQLPQSKYCLQSGADSFVEGYESNAKTLARLYFSVKEYPAFVLPQFYNNFSNIRVKTPKLDKIVFKRQDNLRLPAVYEFPNDSI